MEKDIKQIQYSGRMLTNNVIYNLAGQILPMIVAIAVIPFIVARLGTERFGILTFTWMVVGYFSLLDMGIGRATTKFTAEYISLGREKELPSLIWNSLFLLLGLGVFGGIVLALLTPLLVFNVLKIPASLTLETLKVFYVLSVSIPFILGTASARGVLEAQQRFFLVNVIKIPASMATFLIPMLVLLFANDLFYIAALLVVSRMVFFIVYLIYCLNSVPDTTRIQRFDSAQAKMLIGFGGWLTITNIIGPFMTYMDRFIIGALLSMSAVAYYTTPYDMVTRLWVFSGSLLGVLFPIFSAYSTGYNEKIGQLFEHSMKYLLIILIPIVVFISVLAEPLLTIWLGSDFAAQSTTVMRILSVGVLICAISQVPYSFIQAVGRPDVTAKFHLLELPIYLTFMWLLIQRFGITGAAIAWLMRIVADAFLLFWFLHLEKLIMWPSDKVLRTLTANVLLTILPILIASFTHSTFTAVVIFVIFIGFFVVYSWKSMANAERAFFQSILNRMSKTSH